MKNFFGKLIYPFVILLFIFGIASCEDDFTDIGSDLISNTKFDVDAEELSIEITNSPLSRLRTDNITVQINQYLLGVLNNPDYEKIEASFVSQVRLPFGDLSLVDRTYGSDTTVVTTIDTAFVQLPYQIRQTANADFVLDSVFGNTNTFFNVNVYRSNTFLNRFNPSDPSKLNTYFSDADIERIGQPLGSLANFQLRPTSSDTILPITRKLSNGNSYLIDTLRLRSNVPNSPLIPFARIPLDRELIKSIFLDSYNSSSFSTQENFNNYFRGLIIEASGNDGALISLNFNNSTESVNPAIQIFYTNTILVGNTPVDTISKNDSFRLSGLRVNLFKEEGRVYPENDEVKIQGTAGSEALITLFDQNKIDELRSKNWLINDATLNLYINQDIDTSFAPSRLTLYKTTGGSNPTFSQIKDANSEIASQGIRGFLQRDDSGNKEKYTFNITDYISDILNGETSYNPKLKLKVFNPTDLPNTPSDTIFRNFSWVPRAVTLFNGDIANGSKRAVLKISYSERK